MHAYTITHAIEDMNVLRFHIDYFKPDNNTNKGENLRKMAIVKRILDKHNAATNAGRFNALLATASINDAIEYYQLFKDVQEENLREDENYVPLNITCVFSPPADGNKDVQQLQEDLVQEKKDNEEDPEGKKKALKNIIEEYNRRYNTNFTIAEFDLYYKDVQKRIKDQKYTNADYSHENKIDINIVVDMLLTGFDAQYLNTLYVDKNLKFHSLIQAFSRTNRVLNNTKPYGNILDFRSQQANVDEAIALFSGEESGKAKEIWLVEAAPVVADKFEKAVSRLDEFMKKHGLECEPDQVYALKGDEARSEFINHFKEVQRLKTQLDQYTDLSEELTYKLEKLLPEEDMRAFRGAYLETAKQLKVLQDQDGAERGNINQLDFEFVLFASAVVDYDYIMALIARYTQSKPSKQKMTRDELISLLSSSSNMMDEKEDIIEYIKSLKTGKGLSEKEIKDNYVAFKAKKSGDELLGIASKHGIEAGAMKKFTDDILSRMIFDGERLSELFAPMALGWKERSEKETALMKELAPYLKKLAKNREISGLNAYE